MQWKIFYQVSILFKFNIIDINSLKIKDWLKLIEN